MPAAASRPQSPAAHLVRALAHALLALCLCTLPAGAGAQSATPSDTQLKAAFVLNFVRYTQWPAETVPDAREPLVVAVLGSRALAAELDRLAQEAERLGQRPLHVLRLERAADTPELRAVLRDVHAVFVAADAGRGANDLLAELRARPVLTIGEHPGFAARGGMLALVRQGARFGFAANPHAIQASGLQVSAKVLKLAQRVEAGG
jgi:hypothetical protein